MIRTDGNLPSFSDMHDITIVVARMKDRDKYFHTHVGKIHSIRNDDGSVDEIKTVDIVYNHNFLVEKGINRYEIWVKSKIGGPPWLWKHHENGITVTHKKPAKSELPTD